MPCPRVRARAHEAAELAVKGRDGFIDDLLMERGLGIGIGIIQVRAWYGFE